MMKRWKMRFWGLRVHEKYGEDDDRISEINQIYHGILPISLHYLARARPRMQVCSSLSIWIWTCRPAEHPRHSRHSQEYSLLGILGGTSDMAMDQYLLIPFLEWWTSINPSYFEVHQGYYWFWPIPILEGNSFTDFNCELDGTPIGPMDPWLVGWGRVAWKLKAVQQIFEKLKAVKL